MSGATVTPAESSSPIVIVAVSFPSPSFVQPSVVAVTTTVKVSSLSSTSSSSVATVNSRLLWPSGTVTGLVIDPTSPASAAPGPVVEYPAVTVNPTPPVGASRSKETVSLAASPSSARAEEVTE